jgi:hypothetical protein
VIDIESTTPDEAATKLEAALAALGIDVDTGVELGARTRAGAAAGLLMTELMNLTVAAAVLPDGDADMTVHRSMVYALNASAGEADMHAELLNAYVNVLQLWTIGEPMQRAIGPDQALSAADHFDAVKEHLGGEKSVHGYWEVDPDADADAPTATFAGPFYAGDSRGAPEDDLMETFEPPHPDPVRRMSRSSMALGLLPGVRPAEDNDAEGADHPGFAVATIAGALAARSTLEMINACRSIPDENRYPIAELWSRGFTMGLITTPVADVPDKVVAGIMMRIVGMVAAWHANAADTPRAQVVADLCMGAAHAARSDGLADSPIDEQAEYIALHGVDHTDSHHEAIRLAESAVVALKHLDSI